MVVLVEIAGAGTVRAQDRALNSNASEILTLASGERVPGRLASFDRTGLRFLPSRGGKPIAIEPGMAILGEPGTAPGIANSATFRAVLGYDQRISGRLVGLDAETVMFELKPGSKPSRLLRGGVTAVLQREGEVQVLADDFDSIDPSRWSLLGTAEIDKTLHLTGSGSLRLPAGGTSLTNRLVEPIAEGRLDLAFHDGGQMVAGHQWCVDLLFRGRSGPEIVRVVVGWADESLGVESPGGPALAVQRLSRRPGWHRLSVRFGADRTDVAIDADELVHGKGPGGPLVEVRLSSIVGNDAPAADAGLAARVDDLRLVRFTRPSTEVELDPGQDEARLVGGDQFFGSIRSADTSRLTMTVAGRLIELPWSQTVGIYFRRSPVPSRLIEGPIVMAEWRPLAVQAGDPDGLDRVEGALISASDSDFRLETPYAGTVVVPRDRLSRLELRGNWSRRLIVDSHAHHLGNEVSTDPPRLDPPQPEGGFLERSIEWKSIPEGRPVLVLDVVQVVGETGNLKFSRLLADGHLRTEVRINGEMFDTLNRHIKTSNETPERIRLPIPAGLLRPGLNLIRFDQKGLKGDPDDLDDLGILTIALEFEGSAPAADGGRGRP
jgi:hypothetical protein